MTIDKAISKIQYGLEMETTEVTPFGQLTAVDTEALKDALAILRAQQQAEKNDPLTLEELREMDGEPVYLDCGAIGEWVLVIASELAVFLRHKNGIKAPAKIAFECRAKLYRHKPEEE